MMTVSSSGLHGDYVGNVSHSSPVCSILSPALTSEMHLTVSLLTEMHLFISHQPTADGEKPLVFSGLLVHCLM